MIYNLIRHILRKIVKTHAEIIIKVCIAVIKPSSCIYVHGSTQTLLLAVHSYIMYSRSQKKVPVTQTLHARCTDCEHTLISRGKFVSHNGEITVSTW